VPWQEARAQPGCYATPAVAEAIVFLGHGSNLLPHDEYFLGLRDRERHLAADPTVVFLDDTQACIDGAERVGMTAVRVNPIDKRAAFARTRSLLGLSQTMDA